MVSWMTNSAFRCIAMPCARPRFVTERLGGAALGGAAVDGQRVPIFFEANIYKRKRRR